MSDERRVPATDGMSVVAGCEKPQVSGTVGGSQLNKGKAPRVLVTPEGPLTPETHSEAVLEASFAPTPVSSPAARPDPTRRTFVPQTDEVARPQLTARQQAIIAAIRASIEQRGYPPTVREIATEVGVSSASTIADHLARFERLGIIRRGTGKYRAIEIVGFDLAEQRDEALRHLRNVLAAIDAGQLCSPGYNHVTRAKAYVEAVFRD